MTIEVRPATSFDDVALLLGPKKPTSNVCFCLSYRLGSKENNALRGPARAEKVRELCNLDIPPGVIAYLDGEPVGWAAVQPRRDTSFARSRRIPRIDDRDPWCVWCFRVRPGHRKQGIMHPLLEGAVDFARSRGAEVIEGCPVDNDGQRIDTTMAYVGSRSLFDAHGFRLASPTTSMLGGFPRVIMRKELA